ALIWLGLRLGHAPLTLAGLAMQLASAATFRLFSDDVWRLDRSGFTLWTPLALVLVALVTGLWLQNETRVARLRWLLKPPVQWAVVGWLLLWWLYVLPPDGMRVATRITTDWPALVPALAMGWVLCSSALMAAIARWLHWRKLGHTTVATLPALACIAYAQAAVYGVAPHAHLGWLVWPLAAMWHVLLLRLQECWLPSRLVTALHVGGFWLLLVVATRETLSLMGQLGGLGQAQSTWATLGWALAPTLALLTVSSARLVKLWPLEARAWAYRSLACAPVAAYLAVWVWAGNTQSGDASPLPYLPLLNPLELGQGLVVLALLLWRRALPASTRQRLPERLVLAGLAATAFVVYTGMVLRVCHHWAGVAWRVDALFASTLTQAALSVAWTLVGMAAMLLGHQRALRTVWAAGAGLLGVVVLKLFFVELADRGGLYRIVSFIVVGVLLLVVGYFAPVPPSRKPADPKDAEVAHAL
ncbi:MAG: hypothetical protein JWP29_55, partial [Rhodoferax sp.]|nr:hypothetical protein [Rhodoferax sp.]